MSLNDPQWGKRGNNGGPPDLDEIWRNVNRRLNELFGRKGGGGDGVGPGRPARGRPRCRCRAPASSSRSSSLVWLASGFYIVDEGRRGVVTRFGKYTETTQPGPRWHLPFPIEAVELVDFSQVRTVEVGYRNNAEEQAGQRSADADRRREHHRHPVRGPVQPQERRGVPLQRPQARPDRPVRRADGDARGRRQGQDGLRALRRRASRSRSRPRS